VEGLELLVTVEEREAVADQLNTVVLFLQVVLEVRGVEAAQEKEEEVVHCMELEEVVERQKLAKTQPPALVVRAASE